MIDLPDDFAARLAAEVTTLAFCWRLVRRDGVALGFTSHDHDLEIDGMTYRAAPGMAPSAIQLSSALETDSMEINGALSAEAITEADLAAGRFDGAHLALFMVDWADLAAGRLPLTRGALGKITHGDVSFAAELRGAAYRLELPVLELLSPECRAALGDRRCRVDLAARRHMRKIVAVVDDRTLRLDAVEPFSGAYGYGSARFFSGPNCGLGITVLRSSVNDIHLAEAPAFQCAAGDVIELTEGCDKRFTTCRSRFANAANFQGEPHVPGNDLLTRYPGL